MAKQNKETGDAMPPVANLHDLDILLDGNDSDDEVEVVSDVPGKQGRPEDVAVPGDETAEQDHTLVYKTSVMKVGLGNLDLGHMVNGYPDDPIDLRPYDKTFTRSNILQWWRKAGFLPMTRNALNDPKVRHERGDGGAPEEAGKRLALLEQEYREGAMELSAMGYNGVDAFALELPVAEPKFDGSDEEKIQEYMKQGHMKAGNMMKIGEVIVNSGIAAEAWRRRNAQIQEEEEDKEREKTMAGLGEQEVALYYYDEWVKGGKVMDKNEKPKLGKEGAKAIVKVLMPRVAPDEKVPTAMYKCVDWLEGLGFDCGKDVWEWEMDKMRDDYSRGVVAAHKPLPGFENCSRPSRDK